MEKSFALRGVKEQVDLCFGQLIRMIEPDRYTYYEHGSKNHSGGVSDKSHGKIVTIIDTPPHVSHVQILDAYLSRVPPEVQPTDRFYLQPLPFTPTGNRAWYWANPLGKNKLQHMVKEMFRQANIEGNFTNHSLRATCATQLFNAGVPEVLVQKQTGHKSLDSLRLYERVTTSQKKVVSGIIRPIVSNSCASNVVSDNSCSSASVYPQQDPDSSFPDSEMRIFESIIV